MWTIRANRHTTSLRAMILGFLLVILANRFSKKVSDTSLW